MSVDFYKCNYCGEIFSDYSNYERCQGCGTYWCSKDCAEKDGYIKEYCKKYPNLDDRDLMEEYRKEHCEYNDCCDCKDYESDSCKYCRHEDYSDEIILNKALEMLDKDRENLIDEINGKKSKKSNDYIRGYKDCIKSMICDSKDFVDKVLMFQYDTEKITYEEAYTLYKEVLMKNFPDSKIYLIPDTINLKNQKQLSELNTYLEIEKHKEEYL